MAKRRTMKTKFPIKESLGILAGVIGTSVVLKKVSEKYPLVSPAMVAGGTVLLGAFLASRKNEMLKSAAYGVIAKGGLDLAKAFMPGIMAPDDVNTLFMGDMESLGLPADQSILSLPADQSILSMPMEDYDYADNDSEEDY
jgi:hypothetical protein